MLIPAHYHTADAALFRLEPKIPPSDTANPAKPDDDGLARVWAKLHKGESIEVVTMGDSLTDTAHWANRQVNWPKLFETSVKEPYKSTVKLINPALGGTELRQNLVLIPRWSHGTPRPDLVTVCFGGNDYNSGMRGEMFHATVCDAIDRSVPRRFTAKVVTDPAEFRVAIAKPVTVGFDDIKTTKEGAPVEFKSDRYASSGILFDGTKGQFVSQTFGYPDNFIPVSAPNTYAPGPKADSKADDHAGGHETHVSFVAGGKPALTAGFGLNFVDANYPYIGQSSFVVYDASGDPLAEVKDVKGATGSHVFRGVVILDESGKPVPAIASVKITNGSGWPEVYAAEGVTLDDVMFAPPTASATSPASTR